MQAEFSAPVALSPGSRAYIDQQRGAQVPPSAHTKLYNPGGQRIRCDCAGQAEQRHWGIRPVGKNVSSFLWCKQWNISYA
jgi:hypothetical protein